MATKKEIRREARVACAALIRVNAEFLDSDLFSGMDGREDYEVESFGAECLRIADLIESYGQKR